MAAWQRVISLLTLLCITSFTEAQNLVPNGSFEQFLGCPSGQDEVSLAVPWSGAGGGSDLFSTCHTNGSNPGCGEVGVPENFAGHATPYQGNSYAGVITYGPTGSERTYVQVPLQQVLQPDSLYLFEARIRRSSNSAFATNNIGVVFSTSALNQNGSNPILIPPQLENVITVADTGSWSIFTDHYIASGTESYLTIGNFRTDGQNDIFQFANPPVTCQDMDDIAYYYLDDVSLVKVTESFYLTGDTLLCTGDSTTLSMATNTSGYWTELGSPNDTLAGGAPTLTIAPPASTTLVWHGITVDIPVSITVTDPPTYSLGPDTTICSNDTITLEVGTEGLVYEWSTGDTTSSIMVSSAGLYYVTVSDNGCSVPDTVIVDTLSVPDITLTDDPVFCSGTDAVTLDAGLAASYLWSPGGETSQTITVDTEGSYSVYMVLDNGCDNEITVSIMEVCEDLIFMPSAFTPNNDGLNDLLVAVGSEVSSFRMLVYNRWGQQVFSTSARQQGWDGRYNGKDCASGIYAYTVEYRGLGADGKVRPYLLTGTVTLIR